MHGFDLRRGFGWRSVFCVKRTVNMGKTLVTLSYKWSIHIKMDWTHPCISFRIVTGMFYEASKTQSGPRSLWSNHLLDALFRWYDSIQRYGKSRCQFRYAYMWSNRWINSPFLRPRDISPRYSLSQSDCHVQRELWRRRGAYRRIYLFGVIFSVSKLTKSKAEEGGKAQDMKACCGCEM
jgi:hypothetical protein